MSDSEDIKTGHFYKYRGSDIYLVVPFHVTYRLTSHEQISSQLLSADTVNILRKHFEHVGPASPIELAIYI